MAWTRENQPGPMDVGCHVIPASMLLKIAPPCAYSNPAVPSIQHQSAVLDPKYITAGVAGSIAIVLIVGPLMMRLASGSPVHISPWSVLTNSPHAAVPAYTLFGEIGSMASDRTSERPI